MLEGKEKLYSCGWNKMDFQWEVSYVFVFVLFFVYYWFFFSDCKGNNNFFFYSVMISFTWLCWWAIFMLQRYRFSNNMPCSIIIWLQMEYGPKHLCGFDLLWYEEVSQCVFFLWYGSNRSSCLLYILWISVVPEACKEG